MQEVSSKGTENIEFRFVVHNKIILDRRQIVPQDNFSGTHARRS